ncbi:hypothetical protein EJ08DRAFT_649844 [Tothia fuscella]|uniref:Uncharacterized protein n=1 Tax=Tothia fuscella TaxID=1048955 RepID=A0A9P4NS85_9PEZI|nr:hypothetical protein EJ08DRAFT_649844 [Tothia fuscella]
MSSTISNPTTPADPDNYISSVTQFEMAQQTRDKVAEQARLVEPNLRRLVALCNTLDTYASQLREHFADSDDESEDEKNDDDHYDEWSDHKNQEGSWNRVVEGYSALPEDLEEQDMMITSVHVVECEEGESSNDSESDSGSDGSSWCDDAEDECSESSASCDGDRSEVDDGFEDGQTVEAPKARSIWKRMRALSLGGPE